MQVDSGSRKLRLVDILVLTAADGEDEALRAVNAGALGDWQSGELDQAEWKYAVRDYRGVDGGVLRLAHVHAQTMGGTH